MGVLERTDRSAVGQMDEHEDEAAEEGEEEEESESEEERIRVEGQASTVQPPAV